MQHFGGLAAISLFKPLTIQSNDCLGSYGVALMLECDKNVNNDRWYVS